MKADRTVVLQSNVKETFFKVMESLQRETRIGKMVLTKDSWRTGVLFIDARGPLLEVTIQWKSYRHYYSNATRDPAAEKFIISGRFIPQAERGRMAVRHEFGKRWIERKYLEDAIKVARQYLRAENPKERIDREHEEAVARWGIRPIHTSQYFEYSANENLMASTLLSLYRENPSAIENVDIRGPYEANPRMLHDILSAASKRLDDSIAASCSFELLSAAHRASVELSQVLDVHTAQEPL